LIALHLLEHPGLERARASEMDGDDQGVIDQPGYDQAKKTIRLGLSWPPAGRPGRMAYQQGAYF